MKNKSSFNNKKDLNRGNVSRNNKNFISNKDSTNKTFTKDKSFGKKGFIKKASNFSKENQKPDIKEEVDNFEYLQIEGRNPVLEALDADKSIDKIFIKSEDLENVEGILKVVQGKAKAAGIVTVLVSGNKLDQLSQTKNHQGVIAICPAVEYSTVEHILNIAKDRNEDPFIIILDEITDPYNLGAIIRTAESCGAHGVIIPKRRAVGITAIVSKSSAGAIEHVPVARVTNLNRTIKDLKELGIWVGCADMDGKSVYTMDLTGPIALVIGNEGDGVSRLVKENSDFSINIPMYGKIGSLNASVAAGILMYEIVRQKKLKK